MKIRLLPLLALLFLAGCGAKLGERPQDAILTKEEHLQLGLSYESKGEYDIAAREYTLGIPLPDAFFYLGNLAYRDGDVKKAESLFRKALELNPRGSEAANNLAWLLHEHGGPAKRAEAAALARQALDNAPADAREPYEATLQAIEQ